MHGRVISFLGDDSGFLIPISWLAVLSSIAVVVGFFIGLFTGDWSIALLGLMGFGWATAWWVFWYIVALIRGWWVESRNRSRSVPRGPGAMPRMPSSPQTPPATDGRDNPLTARAHQLGLEYASEINEFGDEGLAVIRRQLESDFGSDQVGASWSQLARVITSAAWDSVRR